MSFRPTFWHTRTSFADVACKIKNFYLTKPKLYPKEFTFFSAFFACVMRTSFCHVSNCDTEIATNVTNSLIFFGGHFSTLTTKFDHFLRHVYIFFPPAESRNLCCCFSEIQFSSWTDSFWINSDFLKKKFIFLKKWAKPKLGLLNGSVTKSRAKVGSNLLSLCPKNPTLGKTKSEFYFLNLIWQKSNIKNFQLFFAKNWFFN